MLIYIRSGDSLFTYETSPSESVEELLEALSLDSLQYGGRVLRRSLTLADYGILDSATLESTAALLGGKRKKKKKVYTTPKRKPHKRKKIPLPILKFIKVNKNGTLTYARRVCENCGPGVFMAKHPDRHYCGTCHATITRSK